MSRTPASWATAKRWRTALVDPPVATATATPFSSASRVRICRAVTSRSTRSTTRRPQPCATSSFAASVAGTVPLPIGEIPTASNTVAIVFAVNWPPHAPAPGQAAFSISESSSSSIRPAAHAPTASKTSWIVMSWPACVPGCIDPP